jgi:hypothetical protein
VSYPDSLHSDAAERAVLDPSIMRVSVRGDVLSLSSPRSVLAKSFLRVEVRLSILFDQC